MSASPTRDGRAGLLAPIMDVAAVRKAAKRKDEGEKTTAVARELRAEIAPAQEDTALQGYIVARRREIAAEVGTGLD